MMVRDLIINGSHFGKYVIDNKILYFKLLKHFPNQQLTESEQICINIIRCVSEEKFGTVAYLND